jgi:hypothetical protein
MQIPRAKSMASISSATFDIYLFISIADVDVQAVVPQWNPDPDSLLIDQGEYEFARVPLTSISFITSKTIKV